MLSAVVWVAGRVMCDVVVVSKSVEACVGKGEVSLYELDSRMVGL